MGYLLKFLEHFSDGKALWKGMGNTENIYGFYKRKDEQDHE